MNGRTLILPISSICLIIMLAYLWRNMGTNLSSYSVDEKEKISLLPVKHSTEIEEKIQVLPNTLPYAAKLKSTVALQQAMWTTHLYRFLQSLNKSISPQVNMVFGDSDHMDLVLNWIIAAHVRLNPPLHNIMVLSLDQPLCDFLASKKLPVVCIAVPPKSFLASPGHKSWDQGVSCRFVVLRIINYWGYGVASYDSDAVLLRNPQPLYDSNPEVKLFAGSATFPDDISNQWGFSLCSCVLLLRSHPSIEKLWKSIHSTTHHRADQATLNFVLQNLGVHWNRSTNVDNLCSVRSGWQSYGPLNCIVFSQEDVCRTCCGNAHKHNFYILHPLSEKYPPEKKSATLKYMHGWFLSDSWKKRISSSSEGSLWLKSISTLKDD